jgi:hypothetical protein
MNTLYLLHLKVVLTVANDSLNAIRKLFMTLSAFLCLNGILMTSKNILESNCLIGHVGKDVKAGNPIHSFTIGD